MKVKESGIGKQERRKNLRIRTRAWVWAEYSGQQLSLANICSTGCFVRVKNPPVVSTRVKLLVESVRLTEPIELTAVVRRSKWGQGMGLQFIWFHGLGQLRLHELLASLSLTRILVVDNDENFLRVLTKLFTKENYSVLTARDGLEGLEMALGSQPDLIFLDLSVPVLSGLEVLQRVRASPRLGHIPVVILIGKARSADAGLARQLGATAFVYKPFQLLTLLSYVRSLVGPLVVAGRPYPT